jgi:hypothetical protein
MGTIENLNTARLSNLEFGQHLRTIHTNINTFASGFITDAGALNYMSALDYNLVEYDKGMMILKKSDETVKIMAADHKRDNVLSSFFRHLDAHELTEDPAEHEAYESVNNLTQAYRTTRYWNFEEETNGIHALIDDLQTPKYIAHLQTLGIENKVGQLKTANLAFEALFNGRIQENLATPMYDVKQMRQQLRVTYQQFGAYAVSMVNTYNSEQFKKILEVINNVRSYYATLLAKRKAQNSKPEDNPIPPMP